MKKALKIMGLLLLVLVLAGAGVYAWASFTARRLLSRTITVHSVDLPIPFPLSDSEIPRLRLRPEAAQRMALEQAVERGRHLVESRYGCGECHGRDFSGGVMVDDPLMGRILGPNLTLGRGSRTVSYRASDWDHIVRHGIKPDGKPAAMPSEDFQRMTDQELSDIVAFMRSQPPVDNEVPRVTLGPLGKVLMATGKLRLAADVIQSHQTPHAVTPPEAAATVEFGRHLATVCSGCHGQDFAGGPIAGGDPSWPPALNISPDSSGIGGWTYQQFVTALTEGRRPDGTALRAPMTLMVPYVQKMTDVEREALWMYLQSVPPVPSRD